MSLPKAVIFLDRYRDHAKEFADHAKSLSKNKQESKLCDLISEKSNLLWFAYYEGVLTRQDLKKFTSLLDMEMKHFFYGNKSEIWADLFNLGY
ncbi:hypothetical protein [Candidatus Nitrososphaera gargensis]|uniref:hypothetical protein n=1 Tax=Candidatus Nitrososphaera gargensis TaxID=497727 RepID=UPI0011E4E4C2|nr:hypothetical protein [Candidatus Nitrososphaera gargensis]